MDQYGTGRSSQADLDTISVLLVDDDPDIADLTAERLEREDDRIETVSVYNAENGLDELAGRHFDCIISDYDMPDQNGLEFLQLIREEHPALPFILYTGKGSEEIAVEAISRGVTDYLQKGTRADQYTVLANRVKNAVAQYRAEEAARRQSRILSLTRQINRSLVRASSRTTIESTVCEILQADAAYDRAWIGTYDPTAELVRPTTVPNAESASLQPLSTNTDLKGSDPDVLTRAIWTGDLQITQGDEPKVIPGGVDPQDWSYPSVAVVPFVYQGDVYGVLVVYSHQPGTFGQAEREMFAEIAEDMGHAIHAIELRDDLQQHRTVVRTVPEGVFVVDENATIELINDSAAALADHGPAELHGESFLTLVEEGVFNEDVVDWYLECVRDLLSSSTDREDASLVTEITPSDGATRLVEIHLTLRPYDDEYRGTVGIIRDITDRQETRQELERKTERLDQFVSVVSHDLRNPVSIGLAYLDLYRETGDESNLTKVRDALVRIEELTEDLTRLARYGPVADAHDPVQLGEVAQNAWEMIDTRSATLSTEECTVTGDESQLQALFENLFRNAVGHGGEAVTVRLGSMDDGFYVEDTGSGIPPEERNRVFDHGYTTGYSGNGVGLTIVRRIAEAHGWDVSLSESPEGGARFEFNHLRNLDG